jgi:hypothetical protein
LVQEIQTKVIRVFILAISSHLYSFGLRFLFLQTHATSYKFYSSATVQYTVKEKGGKPDRKTHTPPFGIRNPCRNIKSENSQDCAQAPETSTKLYVNEFGFRAVHFLVASMHT